VKSNSLYGLNTSQAEIRRKDFAILVEGYFDCVVPYQFGIQNVVASLGTSLTQGQVKLLGRYTRNVVVNFDPDSAGVAAAMRSVDLFLEQGFHVNVLQLPGGEDPDSYILKNGAEQYRALLMSSSPYLDFVLSHFMAAQKDPFSPKGKRQVVGEIIPYLIKVPDRIERSEYVSKVAARLKLKEELLILEMRRYARPKGRVGELQGPSIQLQTTISENVILAAVLEKGSQENVLSQILPELFEGLATERIFELIFEFRNQNREISVVSLRESLPPEDADLIERVALEEDVDRLSQEAIEASIHALREMQIDRVSQEIQEAIVQEERNGEVSDQLDDLLRKKETLRRQQMR
jgi:DNA primase